MKDRRKMLTYILLGILGGLLLLALVNARNWRPLKQGATPWTLDSNFSRAGVKFAVDGSLKTYWTSYQPLTTGMFVQVDIHQSATLNGVALFTGNPKRNEPTGHPEHVTIKVSADGQTWQSVVIRQEYRRGALSAFVFAPVAARYLQIIHTSATSKRTRWVISELMLLQPLVPWRIAPVTLLAGILGYLFFMSASLFAIWQRPRWRASCATGSGLLIILLLGWGLRVADITSYEPSAREYDLLTRLDLTPKSSDATWLREYWPPALAGDGWLALLLMRWLYRLSGDRLAALRLTPALFALGVGLLSACFPFRHAHPQAPQLSWEGLLRAAFFSLTTGWIFLCRQGDLISALLFAILLYWLVTLRYLTAQGRISWAAASGAILLLGCWLDPVMRYVPLSFAFWQLCAGLRHWPLRRVQIQRLCGYLMTTLPAYLYILWLLRHSERGLFAFSFKQLSYFSGRALNDALALSGLTGIGSWVLLLCAGLGLAWIAWRRSAFEIMLLLQGVGIVAVLAFSDAAAGIQLLLALIFVSAANGVSSTLTASAAKCGSSDRLPGVLQASALGVASAYLALFAVNSLWGGAASFPFSAKVYQTFARRQQIAPLMQELQAHPGDCQTIAGLDRLAAWYGEIYDVPVYAEDLAEIQQLATQGRYWTYLLLSKATRVEAGAELRPLFRQAYDYVGDSEKLLLYRLKAKYVQPAQVFRAHDLHTQIGHVQDDPLSIDGEVKMAGPADGAGYLVFGPFFSLCRPGRYIARFQLRASGGATDADAPVATLSVSVNAQEILMKRTLSGTDFPDTETYHAFDVPLELNFTQNPAFQMARILFAVSVTGNTELRIEAIHLIPVPAS